MSQTINHYKEKCCRNKEFLLTHFWSILSKMYHLSLSFWLDMYLARPRYDCMCNIKLTVFKFRKSFSPILNHFVRKLPIYPILLGTVCLYNIYKQQEFFDSIDWISYTVCNCRCLKTKQNKTNKNKQTNKQNLFSILFGLFVLLNKQSVPIAQSGNIAWFGNILPSWAIWNSKQSHNALLLFNNSFLVFQFWS